MDGIKTVAELELATLNRVDWFSTARLHSALGYATSIEDEQAYYRQMNPHEQQLARQPTL